MKPGDMVEIESLIGVFPSNKEAAAIMIGQTFIIEKLSWPGELPCFTITDKYHKMVEIRIHKDNLKLA